MSKVSKKFENHYVFQKVVDQRYYDIVRDVNENDVLYHNITISMPPPRDCNIEKNSDIVAYVIDIVAYLTYIYEPESH